MLHLVTPPPPARLHCTCCHEVVEAALHSGGYSLTVAMQRHAALAHPELESVGFRPEGSPIVLSIIRSS